MMVVLVAMSAMAVFAVDDEGNPNDPNVNDRANACFTGGTMEDRCYVDFNNDGVVDEFEINWAWTCGWHLIRWEYGLIPSSAIPETCGGLLPPVMEEVAGSCQLLYPEGRSMNGATSMTYVLFDDSGFLNTGAPTYSDAACQNLRDESVLSPIALADTLEEAQDICEANSDQLSSGWERSWVGLLTSEIDNVWVCISPL
ncbi:MAG: hypothetical protein EA396_06035 [Anaerolineaceae bacterium]|nr:MAG: hypothetical protein EA396_06035 [Anaerolineaceae bacterium]